MNVRNNRPTFPIVSKAKTVVDYDEDDDDDFDNLNDLQLMTSIDGEEMKEQPGVSFTYQEGTGGDNKTYDSRRQQQQSLSSTGAVEPFEIDEEYSFQPVTTKQMEHSAETNTRDSGTRSNVMDGIRNFLTSTGSWASSTIRGTLTTSALSNTRVGQMLKESSHPGVAIFHVLFKILALLTYILGGWLAGASNFVTITVICIILLACDFWVVKNVSGRLLVGLRWWNKVEEDGSTKWIFESAEHDYNNSFDKMVFWGVIYVTPVVWALLFIVGFFRLHFGWLIVVVVALTLSFSNVYGYWKCSSDQKLKLSQMISAGAQMGMTSAMEHDVLGRMSRAMAATAQQQQSQPQNTTTGLHTSGRPFVSTYTR